MADMFNTGGLGIHFVAFLPFLESQANKEQLAKWRSGARMFSYRLRVPYIYHHICTQILYVGLVCTRNICRSERGRYMGAYAQTELGTTRQALSLFPFIFFTLSG
eukprot:COSAG03_NODE_2594_length_2611_cov_2.601911_3_plen_105_part_00